MEFAVKRLLWATVVAGKCKSIVEFDARFVNENFKFGRYMMAINVQEALLSFTLSTLYAIHEKITLEFFLSTEHVHVHDEPHILMINAYDHYR